jgi:flagellar hook-associated protein 1 FlgK
MSGGINSLFDIAKSALHTSQLALTVTGHNVANVNTPGYSRQEAVVIERPPGNGQPGMVGTGVQATSIRRYVDQFVNQQLTISRQNLGRLSVAKDELSRLQNIYGDSNNQGIAARLNDLFQGLQDVSTNPGERAARSVLLANAAQLASSVNQAASDLVSARKSLNFQVKQTVTEINSLSHQIADLNEKIVTAELAGQNANDLRDQRELAINDLATRVDLTTIESATGAVSIFAARGQVLVDGNNALDLVAVEDSENEGLLSIGYSTGGTRILSIDNLVSNGRLRSLLDLRDTTVGGLQRTFDQLAATLTNAVNQIHRQGYGLDGSTGQDFFRPLAVSSRADTQNQGTAAVVAGAITANSLLSFHDYEIRFSSPTAYSIVDSTTGTTIQGNYSGTAIAAPSADQPISIVTGANDQLAVTVDGVASGVITLTGAASPGRAYDSGTALAAEIEAQINAAPTLQAAGKTVAVAYDTTTNRFVITSNTTGPASAVNVTGGTASASLGLAAGVSTAASGTYGSPQTFNFDGVSVTISGTPSAGDVFEINTYDDAAKDFAVALSDPSGVAASSLRAGVPGNNTNMLALVALQQRSFSNLGPGTLQDAYRNSAATLGVSAQAASRDNDAQEILRDQIETIRAQVSGVSVDEELVNMIKFQRGFEAASRLIRVSDEMLQTILSLKQ